MADSVKIRITGEDSEFRNTLSGIGKSAGSVFKGIMASQIVTKGLSLLTNGLRSAINTGMEFEAAMSQVAAISGATDAELQQLSDTAKHYGETTKFSASQAAEALNYMALAGWDAQQSMDALGGVLDLAAASGMELGAASDAVTDYLSAFGMEASKAGYMADMMAFAQSKSNTTAAMLADAYGNCASSMHSAGQDIETTTALLMSLANQGIKGSEAGTQLSAVMRDLTQKMENGNIKIGKTAVAVKDAQGNFRDLNDILTDVGRATEGMGTAEKSSALMETFTARSIKAINTLLNDGMANVNAYEDALRGSAGTAAEQAETMMDNLKGDVQIFQSALEGLQITASESTNGIARSMVQEATGILDAMNRAGKTGGIGGMADALLAQIPSLLPKLTKGVENLLGGLGKRLPGLVKNLIATVPDVLGGMGDMVPGLIDALMESLDAVAEGVIVNLPQITMTLAKGIGNAVLHAGTGIIDGLFNSINVALGLKTKTLGDVINDSLGEVDTEQVEELVNHVKNNVYVDTEVTVDDVAAKIEEAKATIREKLEGVEGIDASELADAILSSDTKVVLTDTLVACGVSPVEAAKVALTIVASQGIIQAAINGLSDLGLTEEQTATVSRMAGEGASENEIAAYLRACGVPDGVADKVAATITSANADITDALEALPTDIQAAMAGVSGMDDKSTIEAALKLLKLDPSDYNDVIKSYRVAGTLLSASVGSVFDKIGQKLTDGVPDSAEDIAGLKKAVQDWAKDAYEKIDQWYQEELESLNASGKTGEEYTAAVEELKAKAEELKNSVDNSAAGANAFIDEMGGKATGYVREHLGELESLKNEAQQIAAEIDALSLSSEQKREMNVSRNLVMGGLTSDKQTQLDAMALTAAERAAAVDEANQKYSDAIERLRASLASGEISDTEYSAGDAEAFNAREAALKEAADKYDATMEQIIQGILAADPALKAAMDQYASDLEAQDAAERLGQAMNDAITAAQQAMEEALAGNGEPINILDFFAENSGITEADYAAIAQKLGMEPGALMEYVQNALGAGLGGSESLFALDGFSEMLNPVQPLTEAVKEVDMSGVKTVFQSALEAGLLSNGEGGGMDWTNITQDVQTGLQSAVNGVSVDTSQVEGAATGAVDSAITSGETEASKADGIGSAFDSGLAGGITSGQSTVINAAIGVAKAAAQAARDALGIASPSRVMMEIGRFTGEGFAIGLQDSLSTAIRAAQTVVGAANLSPKMDFSGLSTSMNGAINDLADLENSREWAFYLNGREMARASTRDYNTALNGYGKRISLGYGRG